MKIYVFAFLLLALCGCKKESAMCVHDTALKREEGNGVPLTRNEILARLNGKFYMQRIECGWAQEEDLPGCVSVLFGDNRTFVTTKDGRVIEQGRYNIVESAYQAGWFSIKADNSRYLSGNIGMGAEGQVFSCGSLGADGCDNYFKKE